MKIKNRIKKIITRYIAILKNKIFFYFKTLSSNSLRNYEKQVKQRVGKKTKI